MEEEKGEESYFPLFFSGLMNVGNTCYLNAALQCLANQGDFIHALRTLKDMRPMFINRKPNRQRLSLMDSFLRTLGDMETQDLVSPKEILHHASSLNSTFEGHQQADSAEFLLTVLSSLDDELHSVYRLDRMFPESRTPRANVPQPYRTLMNVHDEAAERDALAARRDGKGPSSPRRRVVHRSVVSDFFEGVTLSTLVCPKCRKASHVAEPFISVELQIPTTQQAQQGKRGDNGADNSSWLWKLGRGAVGVVLSPITYLMGGEDDSVPVTLDDCFRAHCAEEHLTTSNKIKCDYCGGLVQGRRALSFAYLPPILIVHLKRFRQGYWNRKINRFVECPEELDLRPFLADGVGEDAHYTLNAVVNHYGEMSYGHYTAYVDKSVEGEDKSRWIQCNDERRRRVEVNEVIDSQVYVAIYRRRQTVAGSRGAEIARHLLRNGGNTFTGCRGGCAISKAWLCRAAHLQEPGPILNEMCYCDDTSTHLHAAVNDFYVECDENQWETLVGLYGGGPKVGMGTVLGLRDAEKAAREEIERGGDLPA